jgi:hypothetical protein
VEFDAELVGGEQGPASFPGEANALFPALVLPTLAAIFD